MTGPAPLPPAAGAAVPRRGFDDRVPAAILLLLVIRVVAAMIIPPVRDPGWPDLVVGGAALVAASWLLVRVPRSRGRTWAAVAAAVFWLVPCVSALIHGQDFPVAAAAMAAVAVVLILGPPDSSLVLRTALAAGAAIVVVCLGYGLIGLLGITDTPFHQLPGYERAVLGVPALDGITLHPNTLGALSAFVIIVGLAVARGNLRLGTLLLPAAAAVAALWSQSRIGIGSALVGVLILLLVNRWPGARDRLAGLVVLIPLIPAVAAWAVVPARALTGVVNGRDLAWIPALEAFIRSPVTGYGPEVLSRAYWRTQPNQWWEPLHAHNQVLQTLAESGLIGAAALVALILTAVVATFARSGTMASLLVALLGFLAFQSTVEVPLGLTYFPISYLLPALCLAVFAYTGDLGRATRPVRER